MRDKAPGVGRAAYVGAFGARALLLAGVWWALTEGGEGVAFGIPLALAVAALSLLHAAPATRTPRLHRMPAFAGYFLMQSLRAGWDVARRIVHPRLPLQPAFVRVPLRLPAGAPTWWLMMVITLLPGTLSVHLDGKLLEVHCLDSGSDVVAGIRRAEDELARLFGHRLADAAEAAR